GGFRRDERRDGDRGGFNRDDRGGRPFERRDNDRGGFRRDDRPAAHRGSDRPFNRDRRDDRPSTGFRAGGGDRPSTGFRAGGGDRPSGRRDDHRGGAGSSSGSFGRRDDKPRWKRNG
ncbi:RNA helicase, partial [Streptomyces sp. NPDC002889]